MYLDKPLEEFLGETAARRPTPGGGSVTALIGALGSVLLRMVGNYTQGKKSYQDVEAEVKDVLERLEAQTNQLCRLIAEDITAYNEYSAAARLPKADAQQQEHRQARMQQALKQAAQVPLKTAVASLELLCRADELARIGNRGLISDVGVAVYAAQAALESAALNVRVNLKYIRDEGFVTETQARLRALREEGTERARTILAAVGAEMGGGLQ